MPNKNTKLAQKHGFSSMYDMQNNGHKTFKGGCCATYWDNPNSKKNSRKVYKSRKDVDNN